jgi:hypothetical protein
VVRTHMPGGVGGAASRDVPLSRLIERARCYACPGGTAPRQCPAGLLPLFFRLIIGGRSPPSATLFARTSLPRSSAAGLAVSVRLSSFRACRCSLALSTSTME